MPSPTAEIVRPWARASMMSSKTFSTSSSPWVWRFAPLPRTSASTWHVSSASRPTVLVPPASIPMTWRIGLKSQSSFLSKGGHSLIIHDGSSRPPLKPPSHVAALRAPPCSTCGLASVHHDVSQVAVFLVVVEAVADYEVVLDAEADVVHR